MPSSSAPRRRTSIFTSSSSRAPSVVSGPWEHEGVPQDPQGVLILGSTGSIGRQTIEVVQSHPELFRCVGLVAGSDESSLADQARRLGVSDTGLGSEAAE